MPRSPPAAISRRSSSTENARRFRFDSMAVCVRYTNRQGFGPIAGSSQFSNPPIADKYSLRVFGDLVCLRRHAQKLSGVISAINFHRHSEAKGRQLFFKFAHVFLIAPDSVT